MYNQANYEDFLPENLSEQDKKLAVRFFLKEREDQDASTEAGRPIFKEVEYVEIRAPGKRDPLSCRPATDMDKRRFAPHYERFQKRIEEPETGTPLREWPRISRTRVEELQFINVKTVEQLADISDLDAGKFHGGLTLKAEAKAWLERAKESQVLAEREELKERVHDLESQLRTLLAAQKAEADLVPSSVKVPKNTRKKG